MLVGGRGNRRTFARPSRSRVDRCFFYSPTSSAGWSPSVTLRRERARPGAVRAHPVYCAALRMNGNEPMLQSRDAVRHSEPRLGTLFSDLSRHAAEAKSRIRADTAAQAIGLDWQRHTGCGVNETYDPPPCLTSKPALIPRRSRIIFMVTRRQDNGRRDLVSSTLISATVDFREASGAAAWPKCPCLHPATRPSTAPEARPLAQGCLNGL